MELIFGAIEYIYKELGLFLSIILVGLLPIYGSAIYQLKRKEILWALSVFAVLLSTLFIFLILALHAFEGQ